jgi:hypothetical protein
MLPVDWRMKSGLGLGMRFVDADPFNPKISYTKCVERNCYLNVPKESVFRASPNFSAKRILEIWFQIREFPRELSTTQMKFWSLTL